METPALLSPIQPLFRLTLTLVAVLVISGCAAPVKQAIQKAEPVVDEALETAELALCAQHFPLRAYVDRYVTPEKGRTYHLTNLCDWDFLIIPVTTYQTMTKQLQQMTAILQKIQAQNTAFGSARWP